MNILTSSHGTRTSTLHVFSDCPWLSDTEPVRCTLDPNSTNPGVPEEGREFHPCGSGPGQGTQTAGALSPALI